MKVIEIETEIDIDIYDALNQWSADEANGDTNTLG